MIAFPISVEPLFGPIAGGTNITIIVGSTTIDYILRTVLSSFHLLDIKAARNVYIGNELSATRVFLLPNVRLEEYVNKCRQINI